MMQFTDEKLLALLSPLALIDVLHNPNAIEELPVIIEHGGCRHRDPRRGAVLSQVSLLKRVLSQFTPYVLGVKLPLMGDFVRVREVE